jgi:hypothetical protein
MLITAALAAAAPEEQGHAHRAGRLHHRVERCLVKVGKMIGVAMGGVELVELAIRLLLPSKELDHRHAGDRFPQIGVDPGDALANPAVGLARLDAKEVDRNRHRRNQRQRHQRQADVEIEHDAEDPDHHDEIESNDHRQRTFQRTSTSVSASPDAPPGCGRSSSSAASHGKTGPRANQGGCATCIVR